MAPQADADLRQTVLDVILAARLTPTEHLLLERYLDEAVDPDYAARYLLQRLNDGDPYRGSEAALRDFKQDWKRLVSKFTKRDEISLQAESLLKRRDNLNCCCMVNSRERVDNKATFQVEPAWIIPPTLFDDDEMGRESPLFLLLEAFLTPGKVSELQDALRGCIEQTHVLQNLLLLSPMVHSALRGGNVQIQRGEAQDGSANKALYFAITPGPEECTGLTLSNGAPFNGLVHMFHMYTQNPSLYCLPNPDLFQIHYKVATALHLFYVEDRISKGWPPSPYLTLSKSACQLIRGCWHFIPKPMRVWCYHILLKIAKHLYPRRSSAVIRQLPFGLYLKTCVRSRLNESNALQLVEQRTSIPAPLCIDTFEEEGNVILVMTRVRGKGLNEVFHRLSYSEREQLSKDLEAIVRQLRTIPNPASHRFANTLGGPIMDFRLPEGLYGPFDEESDFNKILIHEYIWTKTKEAVGPVHSRKHRSFFTHADLNPTNIMIDQGKISGIIDWECAGFFPEYWEFTKGIYCVENRKHMERIVRDAFPGNNYEDELMAEKLLWKETPLGL
ncbi:hypothetical protein FQN49_007532 [Arthroderma sp. PD_2]|nr:hypothetical protein FQN49_007532 [Arthroderma sp. PD_2]